MPRPYGGDKFPKSRGIFLTTVLIFPTTVLITYCDNPRLLFPEKLLLCGGRQGRKFTGFALLGDAAGGIHRRTGGTHLAFDRPLHGTVPVGTVYETD